MNRIDPQSAETDSNIRNSIVRDPTQKGLDALNKGKREEALNFAETALKSNPKNHQALALRARIHFELQDYSSAKNAIGIILKTNPAHTEALLLNAELHIKKQAFDLAEKNLNKIREKSAKVQVLFGEICYQQNKFTDIPRWIDQALRIDSNCYEAFLLRAKMQLRRKKLTQDELSNVLIDLNKVLKINPGNLKLYNLLLKHFKKRIQAHKDFCEGYMLTNENNLKSDQLNILEVEQRDLESKKMLNQKFTLFDKNQIPAILEKKRYTRQLTNSVPDGTQNLSSQHNNASQFFNQPFDHLDLNVLQSSSNTNTSTLCKPTSFPIRDFPSPPSYSPSSSTNSLTSGLFTSTLPHDVPVKHKNAPFHSMNREAFSNSNSSIQHDETSIISKKRKVIQFEKNFNPERKELKYSKKRKVKSDDRKWNIDPKYFNEDSLQSTERLNSNNLPWINHPDLTFRAVSESTTVPKISISLEPIPVGTDTFEGLYFSSDNRLDSLKDKRNTFVMAGRDLNALTPSEEGEGNIILVVSKHNTIDYEQWAKQPNRGVLLICSIEGVDPSQLGLITSRRLATLLFALEYGLNHLLMMDDNLKDLYISPGLVGKDPISWKTLYTLFQSSALNSDYACLSAKTFHPRDDKIRPALSECKISENFGSKIFFLNISEIFKEIKSPLDLFPKDPKLCCEDGFMQYSLFYSNFKVGLISREALLFRRSKALVNASKKTVSPINAWFQCHYDESYPEHVLKAYEKICDEIERNRKEYQTKREKRDNINLGESTRYSHQRKKATFEQAFDEMDCRSEPSKRTKRSESYSMQEGFGLSIVSNKSMDNSFKNKFLENLNEFLDSSSSVMLKNRPSQNKALLATYKHLKNNNVGYYDMATGVGKSRIFLLLVIMGFKSRRQNQDGLLILLPDLEQIDATYNGLEKMNQELDKSLQIDMKNVVKMGSTQPVTQKKWKKNNERKENGKIIISCAPSWQNFMKEETEALNSYPMIILDEFHLISIDFINSLKSSGSMVLGFSATPGNRRDILAPPIFLMNSKEGVDSGALSPWVVGKFDMDYSKENLEKLFNQLSNFIKTYVHCHGGTLEENKGLIYTDSIKDAKELEKLLKIKGLKAAAIYSDKPGIESIKKEFDKVHKDSKVNILITVNMAKKGFDSVVDYEIFAKKNYSLDDAIQMRGRVIRKTTPTYMPSFESDESFDQEFISDQEFKDFFCLFPKEPEDGEIKSLCNHIHKKELERIVGINSTEIVEEIEPIERGNDKLALIFTFRDAILPEDFCYSEPVRQEVEFDLSEDVSTLEESKENNLKILYLKENKWV